MMLKVLIFFVYLSNVYSSRRIEQLLQIYIYFIWLSGIKLPDFRTINYFRGKRLKAGLDAVFTQVVQLLQEEGFITLKVQYIDDSKIESVANKYTFVWRGSVEKYDSRLKAKTEALFSQIEQNHGIEEDNTPVDTAPMTAEEASRRVERIREKVQADKLDKQEIKSLKNIKEDAIPRSEENYEYMFNRCQN